MRIGNDLKTFPLIWNHTESQSVFTGASPVIQSKTLLLTTRQQATEQQEAQGWDGGQAGNAWEREEERRTHLGCFNRVDDRRLARWVCGELAVNRSEIDRRTFDPSSAVLILLFFAPAGLFLILSRCVLWFFFLFFFSVVGLVGPFWVHALLKPGRILPVLWYIVNFNFTRLSEGLEDILSINKHYRAVLAYFLFLFSSWLDGQDKFPMHASFVKMFFYF